MKKTLFVNCNAITRNSNRAHANWILVEDSKILNFGVGEAPSVSGAKKIDLQKQFLTPALTDSHVHFCAVGLLAFTMDLSKAFSSESARNILEKEISNRKMEPVLWGHGWTDSSWSRAFRKNDIPKTDKPVILVRVDGHAMLVNDVVLRQCGITKDSIPPLGGEYQKNSNGSLTGLILDNAMTSIQKRYYVEDKNLIYAAYKLAEEKFFQNGIACVHDMDVSLFRLQCLNDLYETEQLRIKNVIYLNSKELMNSGFDRSSLNKRLNCVGTKAYMDGSFGSKSAYLSEKYKSTDTKGLLVMQEQELKDILEYSVKNNYQLAVHAIGDMAVDIILKTYSDYQKELSDRRFRIEHFAINKPEFCASAKKLNLIASIQPCHYLSDIPWLAKVISEALLPYAYNWDEFIRAGNQLAIGTDSPIEVINPLRNFKAVHDKVTALFSVENILTAYTFGAAFAGFQETSRGLIQEGYDADFTLFSRNPLEPFKDENIITGLILSGEKLI